MTNILKSNIEEIRKEHSLNKEEINVPNTHLTLYAMLRTAKTNKEME